jgi:hypothetical protein
MYLIECGGEVWFGLICLAIGTSFFEDGKEITGCKNKENFPTTYFSRGTAL